MLRFAMTLRESIENNPTVWLLTTLVVGFATGFGAYRTIIEVSNQVTVSKSEYERTTQVASRVTDLEKQIASLQAKEGKPPSAHHLYVSSSIEDNRPKDIVAQVRLNQTVYLWSQWIGLSGKGYYEQKWQILGPDGVIREMWHPFVQKEDGEYWTWARLTLPGGEVTAGKYRIRVFLNGARFEDRELPVVDD